MKVRVLIRERERSASRRGEQMTCFGLEGTGWKVEQGGRENRERLAVSLSLSFLAE